MLKAIIQNIRNFYDTNVFFAILAIGIFMILWDYPILKALKYKNDKIVTMAMGVLFLVLPFVLYAVSRL